MFDAKLRQLIDPPLNATARWVAGSGVSANALTIFGAMVGLAAAIAIGQQHFSVALVLILLNRILDGVDGAVARINGPTEFGGYLDTLADFLFYVSVPVAFGWADQAEPAARLIAGGELHYYRRQLSRLRPPSPRGRETKIARTDPRPLSIQPA